MAGKEQVTPAIKPVPSSGGIKDGGHSKLTTPKQDTGGRVWGGAKQAGKIMK